MPIYEYRCPKCGDSGSRVQYDPTFEQLELTCRVCGFQRYVSPLDAQANAR